MHYTLVAEHIQMGHQVLNHLRHWHFSGSDDSEYESAAEASFVEPKSPLPSRLATTASASKTDLGLDFLIDGLSSFNMLTPCAKKPPMDFPSPMTDSSSRRQLVPESDEGLDDFLAAFTTLKIETAASVDDQEDAKVSYRRIYRLGVSLMLLKVSW